MMIVSLVQRDGSARSFHITDFDGNSIRDILDKNISREAHLRIDKFAVYKAYGYAFASHETVNHGKEGYVRREAYTNTIDGYFRVFKHGMKGVLSAQRVASSWRRAISSDE